MPKIISTSYILILGKNDLRIDVGVINLTLLLERRCLLFNICTFKVLTCVQLSNNIFDNFDQIRFSPD